MKPLNEISDSKLVDYAVSVIVDIAQILLNLFFSFFLILYVLIYSKGDYPICLSFSGALSIFYFLVFHGEGLYGL